MLTARNPFWARGLGGPYPVVNLGPRLGQADRLSGVRTKVLLSRAAAAVPRSIPQGAVPDGYLGLYPIPSARGASRVTVPATLALFPAPPASWSAEEKSALKAAAEGPTPEELDDVRLIDSLFGFHKYQLPYRFDHLGYRGGGGKLGLLHLLACEGSSYAEGRTSVRVPPWSTSPFYCTGAKAAMERRKAGDYFKVDLDARWGTQRLAARNARTLLGVLSSYPLPSPLSAGREIWLQHAQARLVEAARSTYELDPQVARFMVTMIVLDTYEPASRAIMEHFEDRAERQRRYAIVKAVALGVVSLVLPAVAAAGLVALTTVIDARQAAEAARDMATAAKQFAATDARFSEELQRAAEILDYQAAQEAMAAPLSPEEAAAIAEPGGEETVTQGDVEAVLPPEEEAPSGFPTTELLVGGGIAAALAAAFALLR